MSGLTAFLRLSERAPALRREELVRVHSALAQRGPDGEGEWWHPRRHVALAHRALSPDPGDAAPQPRVARETGSVLALDGRLLERAALAASYAARGLGDPDGATSAALLLDLFELRGERALHDLRGSFACVYWDERRGALLLARDAFGTKPLYYAEHEGVLRVASTVKALEASGALPTERDPAAEAGFLLGGFVPEPFTWRRAIRALPAGHFLWIEAAGAGGRGVVHEPRAWVRIERQILRAAQAAGDGSADDAAKGPIAESCDLAAAASASVRAHLAVDGVQNELRARDHALGCLVSGTVASRSLLALACQHVPGDTTRPLHLDAVGAHSEAPRLVTEAATGCGTRARVATVDEDAFRAEWPRLLACMDQPTVGGLATYFASKAAREHGLRSALVGHGGGLLFDDVEPLARAHGARVPGGVAPETAEVEEVLGVERAREGLAALRAMDAEQRVQRPSSFEDPGLALVFDELARLRDGRLRDVDWAASAHGLQVHLPFCDIDLWRRVAPLVVARARRALARSHAGGATVLTPQSTCRATRATLGAWAQRALARDAAPRFDGLAEPAPWTRSLARAFIASEAA